jgi:starch phosphorylase
VVIRDPDIGDRLKVVFFPNFNVKTAHCIYPAADVSEQISTAGKEASGTGNMKFALNGALTVGTLDGANVEIRAEVGEDNFFLFGLTADEVAALKTGGNYQPYEVYHADTALKAAVDAVAAGDFSRGDPNRFKSLVDSLLYQDAYLVLADFAAYAACQQRVDRAYRDAERWTRMSILNVARMGKFSSDRSIRQYCEEIWKVQPVPVGLEDQLLS